MTLPSVSILVPTYGRTRTLCESIDCFMRQDYEGDMQMVILNDLPDQTIVCDVPGVTVQNLKHRIAPLGRKRRYMVDRVDTDLLCFWDDDDIYLPMRIRQGVDRMDPRFHASYEYRTWIDDGHSDLLQLTPFWTPWGNVMLRPDTFKHVEWNFGAERAERDMIQQVIKRKFVRGEDRQHGFPSFIYRRHDTNMSDWKRIADPGAIKRGVMRLLHDGTEPTGTVHIEPLWKRDYLQWAEESMEAAGGEVGDAL